VRRRLDLELVRRGLARTPGQAADAILAGRILVEGRPALKPAGLVAPADQVTMVDESPRFVSRGGKKLEAALTRFGVHVAGLRCLDAGAGTGGFTDALLAHGAEHVVAVDVGYGQFAWSLRKDPRVTIIERRNVRNLQRADIPYSPGLVAADLSFISLVRVITALSEVAAEGAEFLLLVKPQFEARRHFVEPGGVVRDPEGWRTSIATVEEACRTKGLGPAGVVASPLLGPAGNVEFFVHARKGDPGGTLDIDAAVREGSRLGGPAPVAEVPDGRAPFRRRATRS
jgi:23S rRNA (cytidine1920-2'-O)/16S rRNA (cytidine1409-2'-O)-methyltransferase